MLTWALVLELVIFGMPTESFVVESGLGYEECREMEENAEVMMNFGVVYLDTTCEQE